VLGASKTISSSPSTGGVLGASTTIDTVAATGAIQAGAGGMATTSHSMTLALSLAGGGVLLLLVSGGTLVPLRRRQDG
jgi:hypothetical protein